MHHLSSFCMESVKDIVHHYGGGGCRAGILLCFLTWGSVIRQRLCAVLSRATACCLAVEHCCGLPGSDPVDPVSECMRGWGSHMPHACSMIITCHHWLIGTRFRTISAIALRPAWFTILLIKITRAGPSAPRHCRYPWQSQVHQFWLILLLTLECWGLTVGF